MIMQNPLQYKIPPWLLNRQKDIVDGKHQHILANGLDSKLREDLERLKKIKAHRGLRHFWGLRVRGQHTKTTGERSFSALDQHGTNSPHNQAVAERLSVCPKRSKPVHSPPFASSPARRTLCRFHLVWDCYLRPLYFCLSIAFMLLVHGIGSMELSEAKAIDVIIEPQYGYRPEPSVDVVTSGS